MTALATFNIADLTALQRVEFSKIANQAFWETARLGLAVSSDPNHRRKLTDAMSYTLTQLTGLMGAIESATAANSASVGATTPSTAAVTVSWDFRQSHIQIDAVSERGSFMDMAMAGMNDLVACAAATHDYLIATALSGSATGGTYEYTNVGGRASILATDVLTKAHVAKAHARLSAAKAPQFNIPGFGPAYLAVVHPHVAYDLKTEANGIQLGVLNVNAPNYIGNVLGHALGFVFVESNSSALIRADAGDGTVDVYNNIFLGDRALAKASADVVENGPVCEDVPLVLDGVGGADRSIIARLAKSGENLGWRKLFGVVTQIGFALANPTGTYRIESASSIGANS